MNARVALRIGAVLMLLLGIARGAGGVVLLVRGASVDERIAAAPTTVATVGAFLLALGLALGVAAVGVFRRDRRAWIAGIGLVVAFVIDGAVNGTLLYGRPGDAGTMVNVLAAVLIVLFLVLGRGALRGAAPRTEG